MLNVGPLHQAIHAPNHVVELAEAQFRHDPAQILGHEKEKVDDVFGLALEFLAQFRILGRHPHRAGIQMAFAHHDAAHGDQRSRGKSELFRSQHRGNGHVPAGLQFPIHLHAHTAAQIVHHQHLLRFGKPQFPGDACVTYGADRRRAGPAIVTADQNHVGMGLGHSRSHGPHAYFGDELHRNARPRIGVLQVVDELRQVFDGIDVVVRRRRNQPHAWNRMTHASDEFVHLVAGQLAAFAGLRALRDLDLQIIRVD